MLKNETVQKLSMLRLSGFVEGLQEQNLSSSFSELSFDDRLGLLADRECSKRATNRIKRLLAQAKFQNKEASVENIDYTVERKLDKRLITELASCKYIHHAQNVNIFGATGAGKSYLAQALGQAACRIGIATRYIQLPDLLDDFKIAAANGTERLIALRKKFSKIPLLIIDEWLLFKIDEEDCKNLMHLVDRRANAGSTITVSQFPSDEWIAKMSNPLAAEAITDRLTAQAVEITLESKESMRKCRASGI